MRRASSSNSFEVVVKAPTLGLYTRIPGEQPDPRAATAASNVRFAEGVAMNAPGYGVLVTDPVLPKLPVLFQQIVFERGGKFSTSVIVGTKNKLYSLFRYPEGYVPSPEPPPPSSSGTPIDYISSAGGAYTLFYLRSSGELYAAGDGALGLGFPTGADVKSWTLTASQVSAISAGRNAAMYLHFDGGLYCSGWNNYGMFGVASPSQVYAWVQTATSVSKVSCGFQHALYISNDGVLYAAGRGADGQLGNGASADYAAWTPVASGVREVECAKNGDRSYYIDNTNTLYGAGNGGHGEFGNGSSGTLSTWTALASDVASVSSGRNHTLFLTKSGDVYASGDNYSGQLGDGGPSYRLSWALVASGVGSIAAVNDRSMLVNADGTLLVAVNGAGFALGTGDESNVGVWQQSATACRNVIQAGDYFSAYIASDGSLEVVGENYDGNLGLGAAAPSVVEGWTYSAG